MKVLALDPGKNTGVARWEEGWGVSWENVDCGSPVLGACDLFRLLEDFGPDVVVYEEFSLRSFTGAMHAGGVQENLLDPVKILYGLFAVCEFRGIARDMRWVSQTPADAKSRWTSERLRQSGFWVSGSGMKDVRDAVRHLLLFLEHSNPQGWNIRSGDS